MSLARSRSWGALGDPVSFRLDGVSFVGESLKGPGGEVAQLRVGQVILRVHARVVSSTLSL